MVKVLTTLPDDPSRFPAPTRRIPSTHKQLLVTQIPGDLAPSYGLLNTTHVDDAQTYMWTHLPSPTHSKNKYISRQKF